MPLETLDGIAGNAYTTVTAKEAILTGQGISEGVIPQSGNILRYFSFDAGSGSTVTDYSSNAIDATIGGGTWISGYDGFDGVNLDPSSSNYITYNTSIPDLDGTGAGTIVAVVRYDAFSSDSSGDYVVHHSENNFFQLTHDGDRPAARIYDGNSNVAGFGSAASTGTWYMCVVRWDGSTLDCWNGATQGQSTSVSSSGSANGSTDVMGGYSGGSSGAFDGAYSLVLDYDVALSDTEIQDLASKLEL